MRIDEGHAVGGGIAAQDAALAQRQPLQLRQEFVLHIVGDVGEPLRLRVERGVNVETGGAAGTGPAARRQRRIGIGHIDHARHVADQRLQRLAQFGKPPRQVVRHRAARILHRADHAGAPEQHAFGRAVDDHVGDQPGKIDVVGADRQQHQIEPAVGLAALRGGNGFAQFGELRGDLAGAVGAGFGRRAFARLLRAEQPVGDGGAGAGQRQIGHRDVRILHGERQRGAGLVAVQRAVAGRIQPQRALPLPHLQGVGRFAGPAALIAGAARPVILRVGHAEIGAETKPLIRQRDRPVRIAFARRDTVAEPGDEDIAHRDFSAESLRRFGGRDVDGGDRRPAVARPEIDRLGAIEGRIAADRRHRRGSRRRWRRPESGRSAAP